MPTSAEDTGNDTLSNATSAESETILSYVVTDLRKDPTYINYYVNWFRLLGTGVLPMGMLVYLDVNIYLKIVETRKTRAKQQQHQQPRRSSFSKYAKMFQGTRQDSATLV